MKKLIAFIRTTITGGILFLLPFVVLTILLEKAFAILSDLSQPISDRLSKDFLGFDGSILITIALIVLICFLSGLFFRSEKGKRWVNTLESRLMVNIPGYSLIKALTADTIGQPVEQSMTPALVQDGENWLLGFLCEEGDKHSTVFIPDAPRYDAGEIRLVPSGDIKKLDMSIHHFSKAINAYGKGIMDYLE